DRFDLTLPESGTYYLVVQGLGIDNSQPTPPNTRFNFRLLDLSGAALMPANGSVTGRLETALHAGLYRLEVTEPQTVRFSSSSSPAPVTLTLWGPEGQGVA